MALTLATVETAIESLIGGSQSVTIDGISYSKASLSSLWQARKQLKAEANRTTRPMVRAVNFGSAGYSGESDNTAKVTLTESVS